MADSNSAQHQSNDRIINFAAPTPFYLLHNEVEKLDIRDQLGARIAQLHAMLVMVTGEGIENFSLSSTEVQGDYLWNCSMLAAECKELIEHV